VSENGRVMKAISVAAFGSPDVLRLVEVPDPVPGDHEVLVRVEAAGVNPVDAYIRTGTYARTPTLPYTPGSDAAGVVEAVGPGVAGLEPGQRVYVAGTLARRCTGTYAELVACDREHVHPLPDTLSFAEGAAFGVPYATAYRALFQKARVEAGETVFVHGASGSVGIAAVQLARLRGATVFGSAGSERGRRLVEAQSGQDALDHGSEDALDRLLALTGGRGPDVIVEMLANVNLERDLKVLARYGRVVIVGSRGSLEFTPRLTMGKDAVVLGMSLFNTPPGDLAAMYVALAEAIGRGSLRPPIDREWPLAEAPTAHEAVLDRASHGKIVLVP
jgi:NADPH:quinone reductase